MVGEYAYVVEYRFDPSRRWRADFAFPAHRILVEIEGGTWQQGRHTRGAGYASDCEKYNAATEQGWRVLRYTTEMIERGDALAQLERMTGAGSAESATGVAAIAQPATHEMQPPATGVAAVSQPATHETQPPAPDALRHKHPKAS